MQMDFNRSLLSAFAFQTDMLSRLYYDDDGASHQELEEHKQMVREAKRKPTLGSFIKIDETKTTKNPENKESKSYQQNKKPPQKINKKTTARLPDINNQNDFPSLNTKSSNKKK